MSPPRALCEVQFSNGEGYRAAVTATDRTDGLKQAIYDARITLFTVDV